MPTAFPATGKFVGRDEYITRFKARLEHFPFFLYEGIAGVGKTSLVLRLAKESKAIGANRALYLPLWPGEGISSILSRVEARFTRSGARSDRQGDPFARLVELLDAEKTTMVLDQLQRMRREDLSSLLRTIYGKTYKFRILAASQGEPELAAMDRQAMCLERVGPFRPEDAELLAKSFQLKGEALERFQEDAARGGCVCHPLTGTYMLALHGNDLPPSSFLEKQTARSRNAFRAFFQHSGDRLGEAEQGALATLAAIGLPVAQTVATKALGTVITTLVKKRLLEVIDGDVVVHRMVAQVLQVEPELKTSAAKTIAKHLQSRASGEGEPLGVIRAGEILARAGAHEAAVEILAEGWESSRELDLMEPYLKTLASIEATGALKSRVRLLAARARMRKGNPASVRSEMEELAKERDSWTRMHAHGALTYLYGVVGEHKKVVDSFQVLKGIAKDKHKEMVVQSGSLATAAMVRLGKVAEAEKLAKQLLGQLKGKKQGEREGDLHRLLARVYAQSGRLEDAVKEAQAAAKAFQSAGDLYHAATAQGFIGDLYRETGDFELAKTAFERFRALATQWGDRDLIQIAELADAWVSLDIGDLTHAAQLVQNVEKEMSSAPSRRLRRYLAAARAMLVAGKGQHGEAAPMFARVVDAWEMAGQRAIADVIRASQVRSLIASGQLDKAEDIVKSALARLTSKTASPRVASFLRESALIKLRRKQQKKAMADLEQARKLFGAGGNRREEALTLHRIAHAALWEGDLKLATSKAKEVISLAKKIKHDRALALGREIQGRIALEMGDGAEAAVALKEAHQGLRKLGDELGTLHVSESLLRAYLLAGDVASAARLGPRVRDHAARLELEDLRLRGLALTGVALLRRSRLDAAMRCFEPVGADGPASLLTQTMMWRFAQAIASVQGDQAKGENAAKRWGQALAKIPEGAQEQTLKLLDQLALPPRERCELRSGRNKEILGTERIACFDKASFELFIDLRDGTVYGSGEALSLSGEQKAVLQALALSAGKIVPYDQVFEAIGGSGEEKNPTRVVKALARELKKALKEAKGSEVRAEAKGLKLVLPKKSAILVPTSMSNGLSPLHQDIMGLLVRFGAVPVQQIQDTLELPRSAARKEVSELVKKGLVEAIRDGRGQAFRLP